jgi:hypothetical protein
MIPFRSRVRAIVLFCAVSCLGLVPAVFAQASTPTTEAVPYTLAGIDVFGARKTPETAILGILGIKEGAVITPSVVTGLDEKLKKSGKFAFSNISSADFGNHKSYLTVDVVEKGDEQRFRPNPAPTGSVAVPQDVLDWMKRYEKASFQMFQVKPRRMRDINEGHYLDSDPGLREYEEKMLEMVPANYDVLVKALREDKDPVKRASCAALLGWSKDKKAVILPLEEALKDPESQVRNNASRSLIPIAYLSAHTAVPFPLQPILDMLQYPAASDRNKAVSILLQLAADPANHQAIRSQGGGILVQLAGAKQPSQREHSLTLLTLVTGEKYGKDVDKWRAWWKAQQAGKWSPPKPEEPAPPSKTTKT